MFMMIVSVVLSLVLNRAMWYIYVAIVKITGSVVYLYLVRSGRNAVLFL